MSSRHHLASACRALDFKRAAPLYRSPIPRAASSAGRALCSHRRGHWFESSAAHHQFLTKSTDCRHSPVERHQGVVVHHLPWAHLSRCNRICPPCPSLAGTPSEERGESGTRFSHTGVPPSVGFWPFEGIFQAFGISVVFSLFASAKLLFWKEDSAGLEDSLPVDSNRRMRRALTSEGSGHRFESCRVRP